MPQVREQVSLQVNALFDDLLLLLKDLKLLGVVGAGHLCAVAADARGGCGVQRVDASIAVNGLWVFAVVRVLLRRLLLA